MNKEDMTTKKGKFNFRFPIKFPRRRKTNHDKTNNNQVTTSPTSTSASFSASSNPFPFQDHGDQRRRPPLLTPPHNCMAWKSIESPSYKRRVMVVAEATAESVAALQYVLSHAMQDKDDLILINVAPQPRPSKRAPFIKSFFRRHSDPGLAGISNFDPVSIDAERGGGGGGNGGGKDFLQVMKRACKGTFPNSRIWVEKVEQGSLDNKGALILSRCKELLVDLLVVGQRRHFVSVLLG